MASTRGIRVRLIPLATSIVTAASMLLECAINSHGECWRCLPLTNILLLGFEEVISQDTHSDGVWAPGTLIKMLPSTVNTSKIRVPV